MRIFIALASFWFVGDAIASDRYALVIGNNVGSVDRSRLWFAERDAQRVAGALEELGDFRSENVTLLEGHTHQAVVQAFHQIERRIGVARRAGRTSLLFLYFSGHADAAGLQLGNDRWSFEELRASVAGSSADVKVAIIDACEAGALTQVKGAKASALISFPLPDERVEGTAFVASTAIGEPAQESAALGGSFFTHHFEVGLRGAADADEDGRVTLQEAFRYASSRTTSGTLQTSAGPQHPTYEMRMSGRGEVVLADLRRAEARLALPKAPGAYFVQGPNGLFAEISASDASRIIAVPVGSYRIEHRSGRARKAVELSLAAGELKHIEVMAPIESEVARAKGGPLRPEVFVVGLGNAGTVPSFAVGWSFGVGAQLPMGPGSIRIQTEFGRRDDHDSGLSYRLTSLGGAVAALWPLGSNPVRLEVGPEVGLSWVWQELVNREQFGAIDTRGSVLAVASVPLGSLRFGVQVRGGAHLVPINGEFRLGPAGDAGAVIAYQF